MVSSSLSNAVCSLQADSNIKVDSTLEYSKTNWFTWNFFIFCTFSWTFNLARFTLFL